MHATHQMKALVISVNIGYGFLRFVQVPGRKSLKTVKKCRKNYPFFGNFWTVKKEYFKPFLAHIFKIYGFSAPKTT